MSRRWGEFGWLEEGALGGRCVGRSPGRCLLRLQKGCPGGMTWDGLEAEGRPRGEHRGGALISLGALKSPTREPLCAPFPRSGDRGEQKTIKSAVPLSKGGLAKCEGDSMRHNTRLLLVAMMALLLTACDAQALLGSAEQMWLWLVVPLFGFLLVGAVLVYFRRRAQLEAWDLRTNPTEPTVKGILLTTIVIGLVLAVAFAIYNFRLEIDPRQKLWNIGLWFLGTSLGTSVALLVGLTQAERT